MKKKRIFDNRKVTELMTHYVKHPRRKLRDEIMRRTYPLIDAAISRKRMYSNRDDLRQECALKVLTALPKFSYKRGSAFAFLWSVVCNTCITQNQRLTFIDQSIDSDDDIRREAEGTVPSFDTPERRYILKLLSSFFDKAFSNGDDPTAKRKQKKAYDYISASIVSGEFFKNRHRVASRLRRFGFSKKESQYFLDLVLVRVREKLLHAREEASSLRTMRFGPVQDDSGE